MYFSTAFCSLCLIITVCYFSTTKASISFEVSDVGAEEPPNEFASVASISHSFIAYWKLNEENVDAQKMLFETGLANHAQLLKPNGWLHGFANTVLQAYNNHYALVLSPDDWWLLISLSFSQFLRYNKQQRQTTSYNNISIFQGA